MDLNINIKQLRSNKIFYQQNFPVEIFQGVSQHL